MTNNHSRNVLETVSARAVVGLFANLKDFEAAAHDLLANGFDRSDLDLMAADDTVRKHLSHLYKSTDAKTDRMILRNAFVTQDDVTMGRAVIMGTLTSLGALGGAAAVVASGGALALAIAGALAAGAISGGIGAFIANEVSQQFEEELRAGLENGALALCVRVRNEAQEARAIEILRAHRGENVQAIEVQLEKRIEDIPLSNIRPDPLLGDERLGSI